MQPVFVCIMNSRLQESVHILLQSLSTLHQPGQTQTDFSQRVDWPGLMVTEL